MSSIRFLLITSALLASNCYAEMPVSGAALSRPCDSYLDPALNELANLINALPDSSEWDFNIVNGRAEIKIGALRRENRALNLALLKTFKAGKISRVNSGIVVSPKIFALIWGLLKIADEQNVAVTFEGWGTFSDILTSFEEQSKILDPRHPEYLSATDRAEFRAALDGLGATQNCAPDIRTCGCRAYAFVTGSNRSLQWRRCDESQRMNQ